jgi:hypothetical protein
MQMTNTKAKIATGIVRLDDGRTGGWSGVDRTLQIKPPAHFRLRVVAIFLSRPVPGRWIPSICTADRERHPKATHVNLKLNWVPVTTGNRLTCSVGQVDVGAARAQQLSRRERLFHLTSSTEAC